MTATTTELEVQAIRLSHIEPHPNNRKHFDKAQLAELAESLTEKGQLTPALVRPMGKGFQLLAGERRWRAAQMAELDTLLCIVRDLDDQAALEVLAIENNQREDPHPLEEAELFKALLAFEGTNVAGIARKLRRTEDYVRERLRLLRLIPKAKEFMLAGEIPLGHAVVLAGLTPEQQKRAIGDEKDRDNFGSFHVDGLFRSEYTLFDEKQYRVPVSLQEFKDWVKKTVRFNPRTEVAAELFPETAAAVAEAEASRAKILYLTTDYQADPEVKVEGVRTIGEKHWKRADGTKGAKACEYAELGVVVSGELQGQAFKVCTRKDKCDTHWAAERKEAAKRAKAVSGGARGDGEDAGQRSQQEKWEAERKAQAEETARWKKAAPALTQALVEKLKKASVDQLAAVVVERMRRYGFRGDALKQGRTAEEVLRYAVYLALGPAILDTYMPQEQLPRMLKPWGIEARKIVDEVAPKPKPAAAAAPAKKLAGDVRRAKKAGKKK